MTDHIPSWLDPATLRWVADELEEESTFAWERRVSAIKHADNYPRGSTTHHEYVLEAAGHGALGRKFRQEAARLRKLATRRERDQ